MKALFIFCAICCFAAFYRWPISYYTFLRVIVSIGSIVVIYNFLNAKNYAWIITFAIVLILFNPIFPIYLYRKSIWLPFDIAVGILFLLLAFLKKENRLSEENLGDETKTYTRDRIISSKTLITKEKS